VVKHKYEKRHIIPVKIILTAVLAVVAVALVSVVTYAQQGKQEMPIEEEEQWAPRPVYKGLTTSELAAKIKPVYPVVTVAKGKLTAVEGIELKEVAKSISSESIVTNDKSPYFRDVIRKQDLAELTLQHGVVANGADILAFSITNTGTDRLYLEMLTITGLTPPRIGEFTGWAVHAGYLEEPPETRAIVRPTITEPVVLKPGESLSGYIIGKWLLPGIDEPIVTFTVHAFYNYKPGAANYNRLDWEIHTPEYTLS
jgi:hypothetical protein